MSRKDKKKKKDKIVEIPVEVIVPPEPEPEPKKEYKSGWCSSFFDDPKALVTFFNEIESLGFEIIDPDFEYPRIGGVTAVYKLKKVE